MCILHMYSNEICQWFVCSLKGEIYLAQSSYLFCLLFVIFMYGVYRGTWCRWSKHLIGLCHFFWVRLWNIQWKWSWKTDEKGRKVVRAEEAVQSYRTHLFYNHFFTLGGNDNESARPRRKMWFVTDQWLVRPCEPGTGLNRNQISSASYKKIRIGLYLLCTTTSGCNK